jgi:hypothetical protein
MKTRRAKDARLQNDSLNQGRSDPASAMLRCDEDTGKPRRKLRPSGHVMLDQTGGAQQLISRQRDERSGNLAMAAITFDPRSAILYGLTWPEMAPLRMKPASDSGYELTTISKILDSHMRRVHSNHTKLSHCSSGRKWQMSSAH